MSVWMVVQGEYIGIQCSAAKGRYLQARKQGQQRLVFFSDHCGVWEQWKVIHAPQQVSLHSKSTTSSAARSCFVTW